VEQFFIKIDAIREKALSEIDKVTWLPAWGRNRIYGTVECRPDWCISRQRTWGVPCPVFYDARRRDHHGTTIIGKVADIVEKQGTNLWFEKDDAWWAEPPSASLPIPGAATTRSTCGLTPAAAHVSVLDRHPELHCPADLYIEATDQHRGWFQSSLMMSIVARDARSVQERHHPRLRRRYQRQKDQQERPGHRQEAPSR
jgi:isoleucyl-tRNA synthetase